MNPFFAQNSDFEPRMAELFANERKSIRFESGRMMILRILLFDWQMAQPFAVQNLNFEQKRGSRLLFTKFTQVPALKLPIPKAVIVALFVPDTNLRPAV